MKKFRIVEYGIVGALLAIYLGMFAYLNVFCFTDHVDSDIAAESLLAREIWEQKTLTPDNWAGSTERYVFGMPAIAAPFYGLTGDMSVATGIACVILGLMFCCFVYFFSKWVGLRKETALLVLLMLAALPINGLENENEIVPFFALLFFVFADWYVMFFSLGLLSFWFYRFLKEKSGYEKRDWILLLPAGGLFLAAVILSAGGMHTVQIGIFPLFLFDLICLLKDTDLFRIRPSRERLVASGYVLTQMLAFGISTLHHGQVDYVVYMESGAEIINRFLHLVPQQVLKNFGIEGGVRILNLDSLMQLLMFAFLILVGMAFAGVFGKGKAHGENAVPGRYTKEGRGKEAVLYFLCMFGVAAFLMTISSVGELHYYLFAIWFVAVFCVALYVQKLWDENRGFGDVILGAVCLFAILNLAFTYSGAIGCRDNLKDYREVTDYMKSEGLTYGYAEFWDADRLAIVSGGELIFGCSYDMQALEMYWWLTNTDWYPPNLPEEMTTAYVVRRGKEDGFLAQFEDKNVVRETFSNDGFTLYVSDHNYVSIPYR